MARPETLLKCVLRVVGAVCLLAVFAVLMPRRWMAVAHEWAGLGEFPDGPIAEYLARSLSAFYAFYGGLLVLTSVDVRRHAWVIAYLAVAGLFFSVIILVVDLALGFPLYWSLGEGPFVFLFSACVLALQWRIRG